MTIGYDISGNEYCDHAPVALIRLEAKYLPPNEIEREQLDALLFMRDILADLRRLQRKNDYFVAKLQWAQIALLVLILLRLWLP